MIAVAWASTYEKTASAAGKLLASGATRWLLDEDDSIFAAFEVGYQPVGVLVVNGVEVNRWLGSIPSDQLRQAIDSALA